MKPSVHKIQIKAFNKTYNGEIWADPLVKPALWPYRWCVVMDDCSTFLIEKKGDEWIALTDMNSGLLAKIGKCVDGLLGFYIK
ncbi:hypothetical protein QTN47_27450 [Danxiaibacter flavus]|uniref:Uncharacterized protein n=1 Tax=Danxiaibacter flavus TaxID=3049108 RepID=A0ABV3ZPR7_9BACT|nr:hypothetical protein QNM32_27450 [Chitinophagaceae bacterium DXS]